MRELDRRERTGYSRHRPTAKGKTDDAFLTVRKLKRGSYEDWCRAWEPDEWPEGAQKAYIPRNLCLDWRGGCHERDQEPDRSPARGPEAASLSQGIIDSDRPSIEETAGSS